MLRDHVIEPDSPEVPVLVEPRPGVRPLARFDSEGPQPVNRREVLDVRVRRERREDLAADQERDPRSPDVGRVEALREELPQRAVERYVVDV